MILRPCWVCRRPVPDGHCARHPTAPRRYRPHRPSVVEGAYGAAWQRIRVAILNRDGWECQYCTSAATTADHVHPRSRGGTTTPDNLVACCATCNTSKKDKTIDEWIASGTAPAALIDRRRFSQ